MIWLVGKAPAVKKNIGNICGETSGDTSVKGFSSQRSHMPSSNQHSQQQPAAVPSFAQRHYAVAEIAAIWHISGDKVRKVFENEPGVVVLEKEVSSRKRRYRTLLIPESVLERVHRRLSRV